MRRPLKSRKLPWFARRDGMAVLLRYQCQVQQELKNDRGFLPKQCRFDDINMFSMLSTPGWPCTNIIPGVIGDGIGKMPPGRDSDHAEGAEGLQSPDETLQNALTLFHEGAGGHIH